MSNSLRRPSTEGYSEDAFDDFQDEEGGLVADDVEREQDDENLLGIGGRRGENHNQIDNQNENQNDNRNEKDSGRERGSEKGGIYKETSDWNNDNDEKERKRIQEYERLQSEKELKYERQNLEAQRILDNKLKNLGTSEKSDGLLRRSSVGDLIAKKDIQAELVRLAGLQALRKKQIEFEEYQKNNLHRQNKIKNISKNDFHQHSDNNKNHGSDSESQSRSNYTPNKLPLKQKKNIVRRNKAVGGSGKKGKKSKYWFHMEIEYCNTNVNSNFKSPGSTSFLF